MRRSNSRGKPALRIPGALHISALPLTGKRGKGKFALIDTNEFTASISKWSWSLKNVGYAEARVCKRSVLLHNYIAQLHGIEVPEGHCIDHENGRKLTNLLSNLQAVTLSQNAHRTHRLKGTQDYKGIWRVKDKWRAAVKIGRKSMPAGEYFTPEEAARAYDAKAIELFGEFACTNVDLGLLPPQTTTTPTGGAR